MIEVPMKIAIVEDERLFRDVLRKACTLDLGHEVVGEAGTGREALQVVPATMPDLLVLDIHLPDMDGLEVLRRLRSERALIRTLAISSYFDEYTLCRIERASVQGFIDKSTNTVAELSLAITAIEAGSTYFPIPFTEARRAHSRNPFSYDKILTDREQTVLSLVGEPLSDAEIAAQLKVSPETVEKHRFNIMRKLGLGTRAESARFARKCGLTRPSPAQRYRAPL
ncbi:MAG TPA: response regulator transcription factor [Opitutaceae bacterium]|nr:response regulator transcription factor [Opitutaceae bacterium]